MTRILQIRRGASAQNDSFTGLPGEISFDTDKKTIRVHDGETLGGFALARADQINPSDGASGGSDFDINSVPGEFWENIIATYAPKQTQTVSSRATAIANVAYLEYIFDETKGAQFANAFLICQTPEAGYSIGDTVCAFGIGTRANPAPNTFIGEDGLLHARMPVGGDSFWVSNKTTGVQTNITNSKWRIQFNVWF